MPKPKPIQITIPKPCSENWDEMTPSGQGRFCQSCQKTVTDFIGWSDTALYDFLAKNADRAVCGKFHNEQINRDIILFQPHSRLYKMVIALGLTILVVSTPASQGFSKAPFAYSINIIDDENTNTGDSVILKGVIIDEKNEPIIGAIIQLSDRNKTVAATRTDVEGIYTIVVSQEINVQACSIKVLYPSYVTKIIPLKKIALSEELNIKLDIDRNYEDVMGVIQYRTPLIDKWNTGTNRTFGADEIEKMPH